MEVPQLDESNDGDRPEVIAVIDAQELIEDQADPHWRLAKEQAIEHFKELDLLNRIGA